MVIKFCSFSLLCLSRKNAVPLEDLGCKGYQNEALCHKKPANYRKKQRFLQLLHTALVKQETGVQSQNSANAEFWSFCVFAGKNAVYLANQSCKDGKSEALCRKSEALCHKKGLGVQGRFGT